MSVDEICYHMHASAFHVYGQLYDLVSKGVARIAGELPEGAGSKSPAVEDLPESLTDMIASAKRKLDEDPESALIIIQKVLEEDPKSIEGNRLLPLAEE